MSSSELLRCEECGEDFDTIESLREHRRSEKNDKELRNKSVDGWLIESDQGMNEILPSYFIP